MNALIVYILVTGLLFTVAYLTRRRFGLLGLALCAGALLSSSWASSLTPIIANQGVVLVSPPLATVVASLLILLPALLLLFSGPTYEKSGLRIVGAAAFALLAIALLSKPLSAGLQFDPASSVWIISLTQHANLIVTAGVGLALVDLLMARPRKSAKPSKH